MDPNGRMTCEELLEHSYFDHFRDWFQPEVEVCVVHLCILVSHTTMYVQMLIAKDARKVTKSRSRVQVFNLSSLRL